MPIEYTTTDQLTPAKQVKMLIYGPAGVGKTVLACTCPGVKILRVERGELSLTKANQIRLFGKSRDMDVLKLTTIGDLEEAYDLFVANPPQGEETIFVDSLSAIAEKLVAAAKLTVSDPRQAYGEMADKIMQLIGKFCELEGRHVVFIAKQCEEGKSGGESIYGPKVPGKALAPDLPYQFDMVLRLGIGKLADGTNYRFLQTQPDMQYAAKDRSGALDAQEPPDLTKIIRKIQNG